MAQGSFGGSLNDGPIGQRVAEWNAEFYQPRARVGQFDDQLPRRLQIRVARRNKRDQGALALTPQARESLTDATHDASPLVRSATVLTSLSPRPERLTMSICSLVISRATRSACATACADSSAGIMPSSSERRRKASSASRSDAETYSTRPRSCR